jgi:hypothetical protein
MSRSSEHSQCSTRPYACGSRVTEEKRVKRSAVLRANYEGMIRQLEDEVHEYDELKAGELKLPHIEKLDEIAPFVAKMRIAKGVTQTELARRLASASG